MKEQHGVVDMNFDWNSWRKDTFNFGHFDWTDLRTNLNFILRCRKILGHGKSLIIWMETENQVIWKHILKR